MAKVPQQKLNYCNQFVESKFYKVIFNVLNKIVATFVYLIVGAISLTLVPFPSSGFFFNLNL